MSFQRTLLNLTVSGLELIYLHKLAKLNCEAETECLKPCFSLISKALILPV